MSKVDSDNRNKYSDNSSDRDSSGKNKVNIIEQEVKNLFKNKGISTTDLHKLRNKFKDDKVVDDIYDAYYDQLKKITKRAKKFAKVILRKYNHLPLYKALKKAYKYKKYYKLSDAEFNEFQRIFEQELTGYQENYSERNYDRTLIGKTLGEVPVTDREGLKVSDKELVVLQEILRLHAQTKILHSQVMFQSLTYRDCALEAITGELYIGNKILTANPANHVHPIIAAMFLPKIQILDEHFLFANIAHIVKCKHENKPIMTKPDYELYYDLVTDPNDVVCEIGSPLTDLRNRCVLQKDIWDAVLNLRNGRYYQTNMANFLSAVDNCRINMYDTPDLVYIQDEGAIIRRILSAFSFRPTIVSTIPISNMIIVENNPYSRPPAIANVTAIPMVTLRLPLYTTNNSLAVQLDDALTQSHYYLEQNAIIPKHQAIIYSRGVLFFYVPRRYQAVNVARMLKPYNFTRLPMTVAGFEKLNTKIVNFNSSMEIMKDVYNLRSVIVVETSPFEATKDLIIGTTALIVKNKDLEKNIFKNYYWIYDPLVASLQKDDKSRLPPITELKYNRPLNDNSSTETFYERASKRGTIFMYEKELDTTENPFYNESKY